MIGVSGRFRLVMDWYHHFFIQYLVSMMRKLGSVFLEIWQENDATLEPLHFFHTLDLDPTVKLLGSKFFLVLKFLWSLP